MATGLQQLASPASGAPDATAPFARREFLRLGAGFTWLATGASAVLALSGCGRAPRVPAAGYVFLQESDIEMFRALAPVIVPTLAGVPEDALAAVLTQLDGTLSALGAESRQQLRRLFDLLAAGPLRRLLAGVGPWKEASPDELSAFLDRWRASRFGTLNSGANAIVQLVSSCYYAQTAHRADSNYPGPFAPLFAAANT